MTNSSTEPTAQNSFENIQNKFASWAFGEDAIQAAIVIGSQARLDHPADRWSDLDIVIYTKEIRPFLENSGWLYYFGEVWLKSLEKTGRSDPEWFVFYAGGLKVDFIFVDIASLEGDLLSHWVLHPAFAEVFSHGVKVLLDKTASSSSLPKIPPADTLHLPDQAEFSDLVERFYLTAVSAARLIHRKDLWRGRRVCDEDLKNHLLRMLEFHALAIDPNRQDIWYGGRFLEEWTEPEVFSRLSHCFGGFEASSIQEAFQNTIDLFEDLGRNTAACLDLIYPVEKTQNTRMWIAGK